MDGYAASTRLQGSVPHFAGAGTRIGRSDGTGEIDVSSAWPPGGGDDVVSDQVELVGRPIDVAIRDWMASIGKSWGQVTFYLFDPQSWR